MRIAELARRVGIAPSADRWYVEVDEPSLAVVSTLGALIDPALGARE